MHNYAVNVGLIPTLVAQSKQWPSVRIAPTLAALALKLKSNATQSVLTLARIAEDHRWCQDLLEAVLHELEHMVLENGSCPLLHDLPRTESAERLWSACGSALLIEQQTAVRLLLLAGRQSPHLYQQTVAWLLRRADYAQAPVPQNAGLGALIRLLSVPLGTTEPQHVQPAIELALDGVLLQADRSGSGGACGGSAAEERRRSGHVLANLLTLVRLERRCSTPYLEAGAIGRTVIGAVAKTLQIWSIYLQKEMRLVEAAEVRPGSPAAAALATVAMDAMDDGEPLVVKRMKLAEELEEGSRGAWTESGVGGGYAEQIHALANLLDALEVGGSDTKLSECGRMAV